MARATAKQVAELAEVDPSTVSRVLSQIHRPSARHRYDPRTVRRVREAASRLGYRPSVTARALRTGKTCLVGLLVADIASPFFADLAARIERHLRGRGYRLLVANTDESARRQAEHIEDLLSHPVAGLLVSPSGNDGLATACKAGLPVVALDRAVAGLRLPQVGLDDAAAGKMLGEQLRRRDYRRIGVVMPDPDKDSSIQLRRQGLRRALGRDARIIWEKRPATSNGAWDVEPPLQGVDCVVGLNLASTLAAFGAIQRAGLKMPDQIGLTGVDDFDAAALLHPPLTVAAQPVEQIALTAVELMIQRIENSDSNILRRLLSPVWVERESLRRNI